MSTIPRMRTIDECYRFIKEKDPKSKISKPGIRRMANSGEIPAVKCGRATLVNLDAFLEYLKTGMTITCDLEIPPEKIALGRKREEKNYGGVRSVKGGS